MDKTAVWRALHDPKATRAVIVIESQAIGFLCLLSLVFMWQHRRTVRFAGERVFFLVCVLFWWVRYTLPLAAGIRLQEVSALDKAWLLGAQLYTGLFLLRCPAPGLRRLVWYGLYCLLGVCAFVVEVQWTALAAIGWLLLLACLFRGQKIAPLLMLVLANTASFVWYTKRLEWCLVLAALLEAAFFLWFAAGGGKDRYYSVHPTRDNSLEYTTPISFRNIQSFVSDDEDDDCRGSEEESDVLL